MLAAKWATRMPTVAMGPPQAGPPGAKGATWVPAGRRGPPLGGEPGPCQLDALARERSPEHERGQEGATDGGDRGRPGGPARAPERGEPQRDLGDGDGNGEQRENQSRRLAREARERDQVHVDRVQHQLDAQEDPDGVPPRQDAEEADCEEASRQDQVGLEPHHSSFRAKKSAPRSPARKSTARSSNGSTKGGSR